DENRNRIQSSIVYNQFDFMTDDRGVYRVYGLEPGRYLISAGRDLKSGGSGGGGPNLNYPLTYYPGVSEEARAEGVEVAAGAEATSIDITLGKSVTGYGARGRVVNSDTGQPMPNVVVGYNGIRPDGAPVGMAVNANAQTDSRGEFRLNGIVPGQYAA